MEHMVIQIEQLREEVFFEREYARTVEGRVYLEAVNDHLLKARRYVKLALEFEAAASEQLAMEGVV